MQRVRALKELHEIVLTKRLEKVLANIVEVLVSSWQCLMLH